MVVAIRAAAARAARRRGSSTRIFFPFAHGSSASTSGTRVVLPAPGGATSTAQALTPSARVRSGSAASIGSGAENRAMNRAYAASVIPGRSSRLLVAVRTPDAGIEKAVLVHVLGAIDVAQVDHHWTRHQLLEAVEVERAELLPFGDDHQRIGALGAIVCAIAIGHAVEHALRLLHADGIIDAHLRAHVLQRGDQRDRRRFSHVVGVRLEREP